ncbi:hypothetical protein SDC9_191428 [bioreactor metagenome]|uniref:Uncharacterized protein n=1 Tax=bioreactor metagenome TaxID=1076179 RepID=A0A645HXY9_9ZZZZ
MNAGWPPVCSSSLPTPTAALGRVSPTMRPVRSPTPRSRRPSRKSSTGAAIRTPSCSAPPTRDTSTTFSVHAISMSSWFPAATTTRRAASMPPATTTKGTSSVSWSTRTFPTTSFRSSRCPSARNSGSTETVSA